LRRVAPLVALAAALITGSCSDDSSPYDELDWSCTPGAASCVCVGTPESEEPPAGAGITCAQALDCCFVKSKSDGSTECTCVAVEVASGDGAAGAGSGAGGGGIGGGGVGSGGVEGEQTGAAGAEAKELACHAAALDHGSTEVVKRCPPITLDSAGVCALVYEGCDPEYLASIGVIDCCDGTHCGEDASGQLICLPD
jgi:hypothetical protein